MFKLRYLAIASAVAATLTASAIAQAAPVLEPATQQFIDALAAQKGPPIYTLSPLMPATSWPEPRRSPSRSKPRKSKTA